MITIGDINMSECYVGTTGIASIYVGDSKIWPDTPEHIIPKTGDIINIASIHSADEITSDDIYCFGTWLYNYEYAMGVYNKPTSSASYDYIYDGLATVDKHTTLTVIDKMAFFSAEKDGDTFKLKELNTNNYVRLNGEKLELSNNSNHPIVDFTEKNSQSVLYSLTTKIDDVEMYVQMSNPYAFFSTWRDAVSVKLYKVDMIS